MKSLIARIGEASLWGGGFLFFGFGVCLTSDKSFGIVGDEPLENCKGADRVNEGLLCMDRFG